MAGAGCEKRAPSTDAGPGLSPPVATTASSMPATATATSSSVAASVASSFDAPADPCGQEGSDDAVPVRGKSIGHTSVVFKLELSSGARVAWKPNAKKVTGRYKGEVAAYRLGRALGIDNVVPACARAFEPRAVTPAIGADAGAALLDEAIVEQGKIYGATIAWVDGLQFWPLEKEPLRAEVKTWLTAGRPIPEAKADLARQASTLVAFDFVSGNWDRYSGENIGLDKQGKTVLFIDNDAAFMEGPPKDALTRNRALLDQTDRFSKRVIARLRGLDAQRLTTIFGDEDAGRPLLSPKVISLVAQRVTELLEVVDAKVAAHGSEETLYFP